MPATPIIVPKDNDVKDPNELANLGLGAAGAGITNAGLRYGFGRITAAGPLQKGKSLKPMFGVAGAEGSGTQSADAGESTVFPSQFCFPTTKYHNAARLRGMA